MIYIVFGETGEYSDRRDWPVYAFKKKAKAQAFADLCKRHADMIFARNDERFDLAESDADFRKYDPHCQTDFAGTRYYVCEVAFAPFAIPARGPLT